MAKMTLEQWDREIAPFLGAICIRAGWIAADAKQITEWVRQIPVVPSFETEGRDRLNIIRKELLTALEVVHEAIKSYDGKGKVK